jgi:hypothetical protein
VEQAEGEDNNEDDGKQQEGNEDIDEDEDEDDDDGQQQKVKGVAEALMAKRVGDTHPSGEGDGSPRPTEREQLLPFRDLLPATSHDEAGSRSDSDSDDELNNKADSDEDNGKPRPAKRKRPSTRHEYRYVARLLQP